MLTVTYNSQIPFDADLAEAEVWIEADGAGFAVALVAVLVDGARLLAATAAGCDSQPSAMEAAARMIRSSRLGQTFVSYYWGRPALAPIPAVLRQASTRRRVA